MVTLLNILMWLKYVRQGSRIKHQGYPSSVVRGRHTSQHIV